MKEYWLINVPGKYGYSLLVNTEASCVEEAIEIAMDADLFDDSEDAKYAYGEVADESTIKHFNSFGFTHFL